MPDSASQVFSAVASSLLGRTNRVFPSVWLSLSLPHQHVDLDPLIKAALDSRVPIDITSHPALWGGKMRGTEATLMTIGSSDYERACDETHACDLTQAHLLEILSSVGRERIDFYFLRIRSAAEEYQMSGALQALEMAKQEGHIGHVGICCDGPSMATLGAWQFHDAFETLLVPRNHYNTIAYDTLAPLARERRVGIVTSRPLNWGFGIPFVALPIRDVPPSTHEAIKGTSLAQAVIASLAEDHPVLVGVKSGEEVRLAIESLSLGSLDGLTPLLEPYVKSFESDESWTELLKSSDAGIRSAARRRIK